MNLVFGAVLAIAFTAFLVALAWYLRCIHAWELVDKTEFPPMWDSLNEDDSYSPHEQTRLLQRKILLVIRCPKCGAAKVIEGGN